MKNDGICSRFWITQSRPVFTRSMQLRIRFLVFEAVMALLVGPEDRERCERGQVAAIEAAILTQHKNLRAATDRIANRVSMLGTQEWNAETIFRYTCGR